MSKRVLSVGNCGYDNRAIKALIETHFPATVIAVDNLAQTLEQLRSDTYHLVLVNRVLERDRSEGLDVIRHLKSHPELNNLPVMMITNFPDHQQLAQQAGALEGFGKSSLQSEETRTKLAALLQ
jgi:CheY-like chemotaxis protein